MKPSTGSATLALLTVLTLGLAACGTADEDEIKAAPQAVQDALKKEFPTGKVVDCDKRRQNGVNVYEAEVKDGGTTTKVIVSEDGKILSKK